MRKIEKWVAADGKEFDTEAECARHIAVSELEKFIIEKGWPQNEHELDVGLLANALLDDYVLTKRIKHACENCKDTGAYTKIPTLKQCIECGGGGCDTRGTQHCPSWRGEGLAAMR